MKKLNILVMGSSYRMGLLYHLTVLSLKLRQRGHKIVVISSHGEQVEGLANELRLEGIKHYRSAYVDGKSPYSIYRAARELHTIIDSEDIDVVHCNGFFHLVKSYLASRFTSRRNRTAVVNTVHAVRGGTKYEKLMRMMGGMLLKVCADLVICLSEQERCFVINHGLSSDRAVTVYNAIDLERFDASMSEDQTAIPAVEHKMSAEGTIAYLAVLIPRKGHKYLLEAASEVLTVFPKARFLIVGDGPLRSELERLASSLGIASNVTFTGWIENKYAYRILADVDIVVHSSLYEMCSYALLEASAASKPLIATSVGAAPELVKDGDTGFVVPPRDPHALAQAIITLLREPDRAKEMGAQGRELAEQTFSIDVIASKLEKVYRSAIARANGEH